MLRAIPGEEHSFPSVIELNMHAYAARHTWRGARSSARAIHAEKQTANARSVHEGQTLLDSGVHCHAKWVCRVCDRNEGTFWALQVGVGSRAKAALAQVVANLLVGFDCHVDRRTITDRTL
jgi:hypothetical protein